MLREGYVKRHKVAKLCREMLTPYAAKLAVHGEHLCLCCVGSCIGNAIFCVLLLLLFYVGVSSPLMYVVFCQLQLSQLSLRSMA